ncbi:hypothetical protein AAFC00_000306 [Neodothiora populina]|uniref:Peroxin 26 n=1 Tax=Neodothiora populina TaxID=2781224 RepID=A0ABR3PDQ9_9PEZI
MSATAPTQLSYEDSLSSQYLTSSISSLSSARAQSSWTAKTYRRAAHLFLTRRLYEALTTIEPVISHPDTGSDAFGADGAPLVPIATASTNTRVKVWSFYLTLLNAIIELGPEEGKLAFGSSRWRALAAKARDGTVWDEVVRLGYREDEGAVDGEVVVNMATLLLTHMPSQRLNQTKLETFLSASSDPASRLAAHLEASQDSVRGQSPSRHAAGTSTPRDLNTRLKLLELYTLHILPQNGDWEYARDFINMSETLDEERRDAFLNALNTLKEEKEHDAIREKELRKRQEEEMQQRRQEDDRRQKAEAEAAEQQSKKLHGQKRRASRDTLPPSNHPPSSSHPSKAPPDGRRQEPQNHGNNNSSNKRNPSSKPRPPSKPSSSSHSSIYRSAASILSLMQSAAHNARHTVFHNPMALLRFFLFILAFAIAFGSREARERVRRLVGGAWDKVRRTVGMGVKVSYI